MVALGIGLEKIQVIFYEDIERAERWGVSLEELKKQDALDKMLKENREKVKVVMHGVITMTMKKRWMTRTVRWMMKMTTTICRIRQQ